MSVVVALDFDGTLVRHNFPFVGSDLGAVPYLQEAAGLGARFVLFTMRSGTYLDEAVDWCAENGVELWGIQTNPRQSEWTESPKAHAHIYVDDRGLGAPRLADGSVNWELAGPALLARIRALVGA